jgi:hypothetical protein
MPVSIATAASTADCVFACTENGQRRELVQQTHCDMQVQWSFSSRRIDHIWRHVSSAGHDQSTKLLEYLQQLHIEGLHRQFRERYRLMGGGAYHKSSIETLVDDDLATHFGGLSCHGHLQMPYSHDRCSTMEASYPVRLIAHHLQRHRDSGID